MFWFKHKAQIAELKQEIAELREALDAQVRFIHSDDFHELLAAGIFDEEKFDEIAQEAVERCIENADLKIHVRF